MAALVYLDVCCLKRPFDDQRSPRIQVETTAIATLIDHAERGMVRLVHTAFAEEIEADWLGTTVDGLIALGRKHRDAPPVAIANPIHVVEKLTGGEP